MKKHKKQHHEEHIDETWLIPYADMLTLLLALFIVMFAMSQVDKKKMNEMSAYFKIIFQGGASVMPAPGNKVIPTDNATELGKQGKGEQDVKKEEQAMQDLKKTLEKQIQGTGLGDSTTVTMNKEGITIAIQDAVLFKSGRAELLDASKQTLKGIAKLLKPLNNSIRISGHTDNRPISNSQFPSNWELSAIRAVHVMRYLVDQGGMKEPNMSVLANGEYKPIAPNTTDKGRAKNRRVEILIIR